MRQSYVAVAGLEVDITGPFSTSMDGYEHLFVGIERSSHVLFAVPIKQKSEAYDVMLASIAKLERQLGARVRVIRSDGGGEFGSGKAKGVIPGDRHSALHNHSLYPRAQRSVRTKDTYNQGDGIVRFCEIISDATDLTPALR